MVAPFAEDIDAKDIDDMPEIDPKRAMTTAERIRKDAISTGEKPMDDDIINLAYCHIAAHHDAERERERALRIADACAKIVNGASDDLKTAKVEPQQRDGRAHVPTGTKRGHGVIVGGEV